MHKYFVDWASLQPDYQSTNRDLITLGIVVPRLHIHIGPKCPTRGALTRVDSTDLLLNNENKQVW